MSQDICISFSTAETVWRTSSYSGGQGDCVEIADLTHGVIPVRDSKRPTGPILRITPDAWRTFVAQLG
jgi:hypothetical protein